MITGARFMRNPPELAVYIAPLFIASFLAY